jgi:hypothetical protein
MSQRFDVTIYSEFKNGVPEVGKEIGLPGKNRRGGFLGLFSKKTLPKPADTRFFPVDFRSGDRVPMNSPEEILVITPPKGVNFQGCSIRVQTKTDVMVFCSVKKGNWKMKFPFSDDPGAESPVTVNVSIAPPEEEEMEPGTSGN